MAFNPACERCAETLQLEDPADALWDYMPNSPEAWELLALHARGVALVWACYGCGYFYAAGPPARA